MQHAHIFGASQLERLFDCPGSAVLTAGALRTSTSYSAWGVGTHSLAADALERGDSVYEQALGGKISADGFEFDIDDEMVDVAKFYTDYVRAIAAHDGTVLVEQRVSFREHLGLPDEHEAFGTADALVIKGNELIVIDLKTGRGVDVEVEGNAQLMAYALGCLEIAEQVADVERIRLVIVQPRAGGIKEHDLWVDELRAWAREHAAPAARRVLQAVAEFSVGHLNPGERQCKFCAAKATCPALRDSVADTLQMDAASPDEFATCEPLQPNPDNPDWLAVCLSKVDLIEDWCSAVRAEAHRRLSDGLPVPGWKLVQGKRGARAWSDPKAAEELLRRTFRLTVEQAYDLKLISPTSAEKLKKGGVIGERQWTKVAELITQPDGKPSVAPVTDPRPAIDARAVAEEFTTVAA